MRLASIVGVAAVVIVGCSRRDPIDRLMAKVEKESVPSYLFVPIKLPATATPEQCISVLTNRGELHVEKILEVRPVQSAHEKFTAVLLDSDAGRKILLLRPLSTNDWYFRIYEANS